MVDPENSTAGYNDELLKAVGLLFLVSATSEQILAIQFNRLICHPEPVKAETALALQGTEIKVRIQQIKTLARYAVPREDLPEILRTCDKIRDAFQMRNDLAHSLSAYHKDPDKITIVPFRTKNDGSLHPDKTYTIRQITEKAIRLAKLTHRLKFLLNQSGIVLPLKPEQPES
jgi:hypothetical protein